MHLRIILVDDHEIVRLGLRTLLSRYPHFEVIAEAHDAQEALEMTLHHKPDIVVMDIRLPGKNGIEATRDILSARPETKVIMLTGFADLKNAIESKKLGAEDFVSKPYDLVDLLTTVERVLGTS